MDETDNSKFKSVMIKHDISFMEYKNNIYVLGKSLEELLGLSNIRMYKDIYRGRRLGIVCKHISFIVCKVIGLRHTLNFFGEHKLSMAAVEACKSALGNACSFGLNSEFKSSSRELDKTDACPICYDEYGDQAVLSCPDCGNYVHEDCIMVWLERKKTCVYCRSESWSKLLA